MEYQLPAEKQGKDAPPPHIINGGNSPPPPPPYRYPSPDGTMPADGALNNSYSADVEAAGTKAKKPSRGKACCYHCADECCMNCMAGVLTGILWFLCCCGGQGCNC